MTAWDRFWFADGSGARLAVCRVLFYGGLLYTQRNLETAEWAEVDPMFWFPTALFSALRLSVPSATTLGAVVVLYQASLALACVGLFTRTAGWVAFVLGTYVIALPHNFGKVHHSDAILVFVLLALALSRMGDHGSIDALSRRLRRLEPAGPPRGGEYGWPIRFGQMASVIIYGAAGIAKVTASGLAWIAPSAFRNLLLYHHYTHEPTVDWGLYVAEMPWLCTAMAAMTMLVETSAPLALFHRRLAATIIPLFAAMQLGIYLGLGVTFRPFLLLLPFWIPWDALTPAGRFGIRAASAQSTA